MRFTYAESMTDPDFYVPLAQAAERVGFDSMTIADSICYPEESDSFYPYTPDGSREFLENKPFIEAMILAMALVRRPARCGSRPSYSSSPSARRCWSPSRPHPWRT